jgi:hypothetical protein
MTGGNWTAGTPAVRPGLYINFIAKANASISIGARGTVIIPLTMNWGTPQTFISIEAIADTMNNLGYDYSSAAMLPIREALKNCSEVLVYILNVGVKASVAIAPLTATAAQPGILGNSLSIVIVTNPTDGSKKNVQTLLNGIVVDEQDGVVNVADLKNTQWIAWSGTGALVNTAGSPLVSGTNGVPVTNTDWTNFLTACETQFFNCLAWPNTDPSLQATLLAWVKKLRDQQGRKITAVAPNFGADYEGIIDVANGVILSDGTVLDSIGATPWVAGATAGASITTSNTYATYQGATDANPRFTDTQTKAGIKAGQFIFTNNGATTVVETDINSLVTIAAPKSARFQKNRVIRVLDTINNDLMTTVRQSYIGKVPNNVDGQAVLTEAVLLYLKTLSDSGAITNFNPVTDFVIDPIQSIGDSVVASVGAQPVDAMEKFYFTVNVS